MEAVVLAGGFGTRLRHVVADVPKPMAPVCGRPFLEYVLDDHTDKGATRIVLAVGYRQEVIRAHFGGAYRGAEIVYSSEDAPLLTGGAIRQGLTFCRGERVVIVNGDTFFDVDLDGMLRFAAEKDAPLVVASRRMTDFERYGVILSENGRITGFEEKRPRAEGDINGGIYAVRRDLLDGMPEKFSFERDFMERRVGLMPMYVWPGGGYFIDIGVPEDYERAQRDFADRGGAAGTARGRLL